jgi:putative sterol carrier protein
MNLEHLTEKITALAATKPAMGSSIKFATDAGNIFITADGKVSNDDNEADCTIKVDNDDLRDLINGDLNPMSAFMFGKLKISGDMSVAMKLQSLF